MTMRANASVRVVELNLDICIGDVRILPQDIIVGDRTGLVRVPANIARNALRAERNGGAS